MTVADKIAQWLHEKEIHTIFGIIGAGNVGIFNAVAKLGKTQIVCQHHEQACVMSAGAYYRISGRISVALVTTGAGSSNAITGVLAAWMDSIPVIVLSGNEEAKDLYAETRVLGIQGYDSCGMVSKHTKWASRSRIDTPVTSQLDIASRIALQPRQGPVWLDVPKDIQSGMA